MNLLAKLKDPNTNWKYILIVVILAFLVGGGILGWQQWIGRGQMPSPSFTVVPAPKPPPTLPPTSDETGNWQIYSNPGVNFTFRFPPDWEIKEDFQYRSAACQADPTCKGVRYVFLNKTDDSRSSGICEREGCGIAINMPQCTGVKWSDLPGNNFICVFDATQQALEVYELIRKSFELIPNTKTDRNTYRDEQYNYEVMYPKDWRVEQNLTTPSLSYPSRQVINFFTAEGKSDNWFSIIIWVEVYDKPIDVSILNWLREGGALDYSEHDKGDMQTYERKGRTTYLTKKACKYIYGIGTDAALQISLLAPAEQKTELNKKYAKIYADIVSSFTFCK